MQVPVSFATPWARMCLPCRASASRRASLSQQDLWDLAEAVLPQAVMEAGGAHRQARERQPYTSGGVWGTWEDGRQGGAS